jgi:DNA-binding transcriptional ArsR family regulator
MSLPGVHEHLQVLAASGLITREKQGGVRWCRLEGSRLREVEEWVLARPLIWQRRLDALTAHLEQEKGREAKGAMSERSVDGHGRTHPDLEPM